jgi:hypothetical protein
MLNRVSFVGIERNTTCVEANNLKCRSVRNTPLWGSLEGGDFTLLGRFYGYYPADGRRAILTGVPE